MSEEVHKILLDNITELRKGQGEIHEKINGIALSVERLKTISSMYGALGGSIFGVLVTWLVK